MGDTRFRPTWQQAMARGVCHSLIAALLATVPAVLHAPLWAWLMPLAGMAGGVLLGRRSGAEVTALGIRTERAVRPWSEVVDLRAERRGARTVVSVYLESGRSVQLGAPYSGEFFAADPQFELKVFALSHLWRAHRIGGLPG